MQANVLKSLTEARHNADVALRLSGAWLGGTEVIEPLSERAARESTKNWNRCSACWRSPGLIDSC